MYRSLDPSKKRRQIFLFFKFCSNYRNFVTACHPCFPGPGIGMFDIFTDVECTDETSCTELVYHVKFHLVALKPKSSFIQLPAKFDEKIILNSLLNIGVNPVKFGYGYFPITWIYEKLLSE